jgi:PAS domain S-box-containing protein
MHRMSASISGERRASAGACVSATAHRLAAGAASRPCGLFAAVVPGRAGILLLVLLCWVCAAAAGQRITVQLHWKHQFEFAAIYAAVEKGYYRAAGLEVTVREGGPGVDSVLEVVEGRADFGVGTSTLVVERHQGRPVIALASLMQHSPVALLAKRSQGVNSVHDLAGRPVAVDPHNRAEIDAYLRAAGLPAKGIRLVDQTDWTLESLEQGREAAKVVYVSNEPYFIRGREHEFILLRPLSAGIDLYGNMLFGAQPWIDKHRRTAKAFRDATLKGFVYALDHPTELADLILARYNTQNKTRDHLLFEAKEIRELTRPDIVEPGYMSPGRWRHVASIYAGHGMLPADFDLTGFAFDEAENSGPAWIRDLLVVTLVGLGGTMLVVLRFRRLNAALAERGRLLDAIVDNEPDCVKLLDREGRLLKMNRAGLEMIEAQSEAQVVGHVVSGIVRPAHRSAFDELTRRCFDKGESGTLVFEIEGLAGTRRWLETHAVPLRDDRGEVVRLLGVTRDITAQRQAEAELERHRAGLEEQVRERTAELVRARDEAQRLMRAKSEFLANMSHEIRTPLNAVLGFAEIGARDGAGLAVEGAFLRIREAGEHLLRVVNDILDFSKIDAGKLAVERQPFRLAAVLANASSLIADAARDKGLAYEVNQAADLPVWVDGDAMRVQQILVNLLSNAVKFTQRGGVRLCVARDGDEIYFKVIDSGIGMSREELSRIFRPFEQADSSTTRKYGGTGLGLVISRDLAALMGGEIWAESAAAKGSTFTLRLALPEVRQAPPAPVAQTAPMRLLGIRVLAAEDAEVNRLILQHMLDREGALVTFADDGEQALQRLRQSGARGFDVVLMDLQMPNMDGYEATRLIRALAPDLPVIGLTAHALDEERQRCLSAGMVEHQTKPVDLDELVASILRHTAAAPAHSARAAAPACSAADRALAR